MPRRDDAPPVRSTASRRRPVLEDDAVLHRGHTRTIGVDKCVIEGEYATHKSTGIVGNGTAIDYQCGAPVDNGCTTGPRQDCIAADGAVVNCQAGRAAVDGNGATLAIGRIVGESATVDGYCAITSLLAGVVVDTSIVDTATKFVSTYRTVAGDGTVVDNQRTGVGDAAAVISTVVTDDAVVDG